jgi:hypothetical protein
VLLDQMFLAHRDGIDQTLAASAAACLVLGLTVVALFYVYIVSSKWTSIVGSRKVFATWASGHAGAVLTARTVGVSWEILVPTGGAGLVVFLFIVSWPSRAFFRFRKLVTATPGRIRTRRRKSWVWRR